MDDLLAKFKATDLAQEAERMRMLSDARSKGIETSGPVGRVIKAALTRLVTTIGL